MDTDTAVTFRLVALDIDGTIRSDEHPISDRTREVIDRVREAGAAVTLATGRTFKSAVRQTAELNITTPIATFQGAQVSEPVSGDVLWHMPLTQPMTRTAIAALDGWDVQVMGYRGDAVFVSEMTDWSSGYGKRNGVEVNEVGDLAAYSANEMTRLVAKGDDDVIESLETALRSQFDSDLYVTRSLSYFCEILHPEGGKDKALDWLCGHLGIETRATLVFGNGYNDIPMLQWGGHSVAVGGAVPQALEAADVVAPPIEEEGVAQILEDFLDRGLIG
ncbi:MAG: Cof-type HAD-IIB family hydrolase [SAR202 cluster bacterium]|jgi:hypothetical protein|nr:Cof-type HAD-IIB family hydrolase [SAR202 cluster bacterium]MQG58771.1 Cof-type HAD-IIB family hydrolase [SAR202 cluster bacterium]MQG68247.1 Cof-type HAD-IIB family hydrolase [SAR202 cluster bacterium]HAL48847.1 hypothetical protein [Dehalococcoidia bacterium]|tara:strand:+ start:8901 stop:9728 length:828 start_codon:yes stop_codon:yes gene_type:complete